MKYLNLEIKDFNSIQGKDTDIKTGLLIGAVLESTAYVYVLASTPVIHTEANDLYNMLNYKLDEASSYSDWILEHARQIDRLLPGGLNILGLYSFSNYDSLIDGKESSDCIRSIQSVLQGMNSQVVRGDRLVHLHISEKRRTIVRSFEFKCNKVSVIELKQGPNFKLEELRCKINIQLNSENQEGTLQNAIQKLLNQFSSQLNYTKFMIDGLTVPESLLPTLKSDLPYHTVDIFSTTPGLQLNLDSHATRILGTIDSRAYVVSKSSIRYVTSLIKEDILKSVKHRLDLLSDEYLQNENPFFQQDFRTIDHSRINLPRRVWYRNTHEIALCDYLLFSEKSEDSLERMGGLIGAGLGDLEALEEQQPEIDLPKKSNLQRSRETSVVKKSYKNQIFIIVSVVFLFIGFLFSSLGNRG